MLAGTHGFSPAVHTSRLLTSVRKTLDLLRADAITERMRDVDATRDEAQQTLDSLKEFGDIVDTGGGYWLGTPLRVVRSSDALLAIGSAPNAVLKALLGAPPTCAGISRFGDVRSNESAGLAISVSQWLGEEDDILSWTRRILGLHEQSMRSGNDVPTDQLEIYAPDLLTRAYGNPWIAAQSISEPMLGVRLCRPIESYAYVWDRPFYLSHFRSSSGGLVMTRSVRVDFNFTRRLRFGLSKLYGRAQTISATSGGELVELEMPVALPNPEARIAALGWPLPSNPRRSVFHRRAIPFLAEVMRRLAVQIIVR
jgi:hypothetical protein